MKPLLLNGGAGGGEELAGSPAQPLGLLGYWVIEKMVFKEVQVRHLGGGTLGKQIAFFNGKRGGGTNNR